MSYFQVRKQQYCNRTCLTWLARPTFVMNEIVVKFGGARYVFLLRNSHKFGKAVWTLTEIWDIVEEYECICIQFPGRVDLFNSWDWKQIWLIKHKMNNIDSTSCSFKHWPTYCENVNYILLVDFFFVFLRFASFFQHRFWVCAYHDQI